MTLAKSLQAAAGNAGGDALYVDDVFSTYLYTGNGSTQTITNGIDLAGEGGMVWLKQRSTTRNHVLFDTLRGATKKLYSNLTNAQGTDAASLTAFNSNGFDVGSDSDSNISAGTYASWTFRKAPKFFDVVTYTGNGTTQSIAHNLGSVPGCIIVKRVSAASNTGWPVYHRFDYQQHGFLNLEGGFNGAQEETWFGNNLVSVAPTASVFTVGSNQDINASSNTYVAYLFAHNDGGFGADGSENVISCGSFTTDGSGNATVTLGYEPQWVLVKGSNIQSYWYLFDAMRGFGVTQNSQLWPHLSNAEASVSTLRTATSTGMQFASFNSADPNSTFVYVAIRRPMKPPSAGTEVFAPTTYTGAGTSQTVTSGLQTAGGSLVIIQDRTNGSASRVYDTLRGPFQEIYTQSTSAEVNRTSIDAGLKTFNMNGFSLGSYNYNGTNESSIPYIAWQLRRASGFFDVVCYTGTGVARTVNHNLTVAPELMIVKRRSALVNWAVYSATTGNTKYLVLNNNNAAATDATYWNSTTPTSTVFSLGSSATPNQNTQTYVAYLFATYPGVSKVGSYTGTGTTLQVNCGFTSGARFVLIKRTDSTGDWYVWDSARGIVAGNDPYLLLNSTAAEVTNTDYVDTYSAGFEISSTAPAAINANGGSFIFFAVA